MPHTPFTHASFRLSRLSALTLIAAAALSACGGGGGSPGSTGSVNNGGSGGGTVVSETKVTLVLVDASGNTLSSLAGGQSAILKATVLTPSGAPAANAIVQFAAGTAGLVQMTPETGSALTDAKGVATVTIKPLSYTTMGALALTATAVVDGKTGTASVNLAISAAPLTLGALSFATPPTGPLPAFSTTTLLVPITSNGKAATEATGLSLTSLCVSEGTATLVAGALVDGVLSAIYTNNGCLRGTDMLTATLGSAVQSIPLAVSAANIGAIQFAKLSLEDSSIVLKGSGGLGRAESAQVTFNVVDQQGRGLAGVEVTFGATTYAGGLTVSPTTALTDSTGAVVATVTSGTVPTPVRVTASASRNGATISGMSDTLTISTGLPIQKAMTLGADVLNIEGWDFNGAVARFGVRLADQYGNPVSDGAAVSFVTEGGAIGTSARGGCISADGGCEVDLVSQNPRPTDGRVTVLAYTQGIENFVDLNGDGQYSCNSFVGADGNPVPTYRPLVDTCVSGGEPFPTTPGLLGDMGDPFLDTNVNGVYEAALGDLPFPFKGANFSANGDGKWGMNYLRQSMEIVFSGSSARLREVCGENFCIVNADGATITLPGLSGANCAVKNLSVRAVDANNNPLPYGTTVAITEPLKLSVGAVAPATVPSTNNIGGTVHQFRVTPDLACAAGEFTLQFKTPRGKITEFKFKAN